MPGLVKTCGLHVYSHFYSNTLRASEINPKLIHPLPVLNYGGPVGIRYRFVTSPYLVFVSNILSLRPHIFHFTFE
jgi:hypothetical protein